jgi:hypothetical protein
MNKDIQRIISNTGKAELIERLTELLKNDGARCLVFVGVPRENNTGKYIHDVFQSYERGRRIIPMKDRE